MKNHPMKIYIALFLSCASIMAADTGIHIATTIISPGWSVDVFTRDGQTNLVCDTRTKDGVLEMRTQTFYHDGLKVGAALTTPEVQDYISGTEVPYSLSFIARSPQDARFAYVRAKDGSYVDVFTCTNGVYYPAESRMITEFNDSQKQAVTQARSSSK
jgi:hypothetical protein